MEALFGRSDLFPVGIGATCHVGIFLFELYAESRKLYPRSVFDHMELPMWAVCELVEQDFVDFLNKSLFKPIRRIRFKDNLWMTHCKYNIRFNGILGVDLGVEQKTIDDSRWDIVTSFYTKQLSAWKTLLTEKKPLVFFRLEYESPSDSMIYPQFYKPEPELVYLERFAKWLESKEVPYHIVWFSKQINETSYDAQMKIAKVPYQTMKPGDILNGDQLLSHVKRYLPFLQATLQQSIPRT